MTPTQRRAHYLAYGIRRGLSPEDAADFAQDAFVRFLGAGVELHLNYVYIDFMRASRGRTGTHREQAFMISLDEPLRWVLRHEAPSHEALKHYDKRPEDLMAMLEDTAERLGVKRKVWRRRLIRILTEIAS